MGKLKNILIIILCMGLAASCTKPNVLEDLASKNSDEALYIDAKKQIDDSAWDNAIAILENQLSAGFKARRDVLNTRAGAYAGKCGIKFTTLVNGLKNASGGASKIFPYMMGIFSGVTVTPAACESAISLMQQIGDETVRDTNENLFVSILGLARIATTLANKLDSVDHDGVIDASTNVCHEWAAAAPHNALWPWTDPILLAAFPPPAMPAQYLTDSEIQKIAAGVGLIIETLPALSSVIGGGNSLVTAVAGVTALCASVGTGAGGITVVCDETIPALVTNNSIYAFRALLDSNSLGFGTCVPGSNNPGQLCCPSLKIPPWP